MPSPVMSLEQFVEAVFPLRGIDVSTEIAEQREGTTRVGVNVRVQEPQTLRNRGGARPGMEKYIAAQVNGDNPIQMLDIIVDPTTDALLSEDLTGDIVDPSTSNLSQRQPKSGARRIRRKGSGAWFSRNTPKSKLTVTAEDQTKLQGSTFTWVGDEFTASGIIAGDTISNVQMSSPGAGASAAPGTYPISVGAITGTVIGAPTFTAKYKVKRVQGNLTVTLVPNFAFRSSASMASGNAPSNGMTMNGVQANDLVVVGVGRLAAGALTISDSTGNTYTRVGTTTANGVTVDMFWAIAKTAGNIQIVGSDSARTSFMGALALSGAGTMTPLDGFTTNFGTSSAYSSGVIPGGAVTKELLVAAIASPTLAQLSIIQQNTHEEYWSQNFDRASSSDNVLFALYTNDLSGATNLPTPPAALLGTFLDTGNNPVSLAYASLGASFQ